MVLFPGSSSREIAHESKQSLYCSIRSWKYKLLYTPPFVTECLQKPRFFFRQAVEMYFSSVCFYLGAVAGFVRLAHLYEGSCLLSRDLSRRDREKTCSLNTFFHLSM